MPIQYINTGTAANKGNGDTLRVAFNKVNDNFRQLASPLELSKNTVGEVISNPALQTGITVTYNTLTQFATFALNTATALSLGGVRVGLGLTINPTTGVLSGFNGSYNSLTNIPQPLGTTNSPTFNSIAAAGIDLNGYAVTVDNFGNLIVNSRPLLETLDFAGSSITSIDPVQPLQLISFNTSTRTAIELYPGYSSVLVTGDLAGRQPNTYNLGDDQNPWRGIWVGTDGVNFSDGSSLKTANGLGGGSGFQLTSSTARVTLTSDGCLTFPDNTLKNKLVLLASGTSTNVATVLSTGTNNLGVDYVGGTFTLANIPANIPLFAHDPVGWYISGSGLVGQKPIAQTRDHNPGAGTITIRVDRTDGSTFRVATEPNNVYVISQYIDNFNIQVVDKIWNFSGAAGQLTAPGNIIATKFIGNLTGTSSYATTASYALSFNTSTLVAQAVSALTANTASYATTASSLANGVYSLVLGTTGTVTAPGNIMPTTDLAYDLGSPTLQWRSLYVGTSTIFIGGVPISINTVTNTLRVGSASTTTAVANIATENYVFDAISNANTQIDIIKRAGLDWEYADFGIDPYTGSPGRWNDMTRAGNMLFSLSNEIYGNGGAGNLQYRYSSDGITWAQSELPNQANNAADREHLPGVYDGNKWIAYGNGKYVIMESQNPFYHTSRYVKTSTDGINWTRHQNTVPWAYSYPNRAGNDRGNLWYATIFDGTKFIALGGESYYQRPSVMNSDDGINWTQVSPRFVVVNNVETNDPTTDSLYLRSDYTDENPTVYRAGFHKWVDMASDGNVLVAMGEWQWAEPGTTPWQSDNVALSYDHGAHWEYVKTPIKACWSDIEYGNGTFIAIGRRTINPISGESIAVVVRSTDGGRTWTQSTIATAGSTDYVTSAAYGDGNWVLCKTSLEATRGTILVSTDGGRTFIFKPLQPAPDYLNVLQAVDCREVEYINGRFVAIWSNGPTNSAKIIQVSKTKLNFNDCACSTLVNGIHRLSVGTTGTVTFPSVDSNTRIVSTGSILLTANSSTWIFSSTGTLTAPGNIIPNTDLAYDLGSPTRQWRSLYVGTSTIFIGGVPISVNTVTNTLRVGSTATTVANIATENYVFNIVSTATTSTLVNGVNSRLTLSNTGTVTFPTYNSTARLTSTGSVSLTANSSTWIFSSTGTLTAPGDIVVNGLTVGRGPGNTVTNTVLGFEALKLATANNTNNVAVGYQALDNFGTAGAGSVTLVVSYLTGLVDGDTVVTEGYQVYSEGNPVWPPTPGVFSPTVSISIIYDSDSGNNIPYISIVKPGSNLTVGMRFRIEQYEGYVFEFTVDTLTYGNNNTVIGSLAGNTTSGSNNTFLGYNAQPSSSDSIHEIVIGAGAIGGGTKTTTIGSRYYTNTTRLYGDLRLVDDNNDDGGPTGNWGLRFFYGRVKGTIFGNLAPNTQLGYPSPNSIEVTGLATLSGITTINGALQLTGSDTVAQNIATNQTSGTLAIGGASGTAGIVFGRSTVTQAVNIATGATVSGSTKTVNIGTGGLSGSTSTITIGATSGTTNIVLNGTTRATAAEGTAITTSAGLGYIGMPQISTATSYTLVASDQGKHIYITATAQTITIPANASVAFPIGTTISLIAGPSATSTTISITSDTMYLGGTGTTGNRTLAAYGMATLVKVSATAWFINGSGLT